MAIRSTFALSISALILVSLVAGIAAQPAVEARTFAAGQVSETVIVAALGGQYPDRFRPVGTSSITFQVDLAGTIDAAFKPETSFHPRGWLAEVAAYRIGRELGLDNVPPAVTRAIDRTALERRIDTSPEIDRDELARSMTTTGGTIRGAFIYWVPGLLRSDLDQPDGIRRWTGWLTQGTPLPEGEALRLARDMSNMVLFDYLIANRDRWSGGNVRPVEGGRMIIRDHNLAFPLVLPEAIHRRIVSFFMRAQRFSRGTVERLIAMDEASLRAAMENHDPASILDERQIQGVLERRAAILSYVGALIEAHGEENVLVFE